MRTRLRARLDAREVELDREGRAAARRRVDRERAAELLHPLARGAQPEGVGGCAGVGIRLT